MLSPPESKGSIRAATLAATAAALEPSMRTLTLGQSLTQASKHTATAHTSSEAHSNSAKAISTRRVAAMVLRISINGVLSTASAVMALHNSVK